MSHNFDKCTDCTEQNLPYDLDSIMHYGAYAFSKNGRKTIDVIGNSNYPIGRKEAMSSLDIRGVNLLYDCQHYLHHGKITLTNPML